MGDRVEDVAMERAAQKRSSKSHPSKKQDFSKI